MTGRIRSDSKKPEPHTVLHTVVIIRFIIINCYHPPSYFEFWASLLGKSPRGFEETEVS